MQNTVNLYRLPLSSLYTYYFALIFVIGNLALPQIAHLIPQGGLIFLPIYFFTLVGSYKYGVHVGILTAILSPVLNNLLFSMPPTDVLPIILIKSSLLAIAASVVAKHFHKVSFIGIIISIFTYQLVGTLAEWVIVNDFNKAIQDFNIGLPGILFQIIGGYYILKALQKI